MSKQLNSISGFGSILTNVGEMKNTGFEIEVRSSNIQTKDFSWTTSLNLSHNKNKIVKLADLPEFIDGNYIRKEGCSYATIYLREYAGVDLMTDARCIMTIKKTKMAIEAGILCMTPMMPTVWS